MSRNYISNSHYLNKITEPGLTSIGLTILISALIWTLGYYIMPDEIWNCSTSGPIDRIISKKFDTYSLRTHALGFITNLLAGLMLYMLNERHTIIGKQTTLPLFFYMLMMGLNANVHSFMTANIASIPLIISISEILSTYRNPTPIKEAFCSGIALATASLMCEEYILLVIVLIHGMWILNSLSFRSLLNVINGILLVYILFFGVVFLYDKELLYTMTNAYIEDFNIPYPEYNINLIVILFYGIQLICIGWSIISAVNKSYLDNIKGSKMIKVMLAMWTTSVASFFIFSDKMPTFYSICIISESIILSHYFTLNKDITSKILFSSIMGCSVIYFLNTIIFQ